MPVSITSEIKGLHTVSAFLSQDLSWFHPRYLARSCPTVASNHGLRAEGLGVDRGHKKTFKSTHCMCSFMKRTHFFLVEENLLAEGRKVARRGSNGLLPGSGNNSVFIIKYKSP